MVILNLKLHYVSSRNSDFCANIPFSILSGCRLMRDVFGNALLESWPCKKPVAGPVRDNVIGVGPGSLADKDLSEPLCCPKRLGHELINVVKNGMSQSVRIREAKVQAMWCIFKPLRRCSWTDWTEILTISSGR